MGKSMAVKKRETLVFNGKCYNFALGFIEERLVKHGGWTSEKAMKLSDKLSKEIKKTVKGFFTRQNREAAKTK
jgi:hypothetical protein